jgi:hypothetical protein
MEVVYFVLDDHKDTVAACEDIFTAMEIMRARGRRARVEREDGTVMAYMAPANTWAPNEHGSSNWAP